jgi:RND family efflux transporter MFP subunit
VQTGSRLGRPAIVAAVVAAAALLTWAVWPESAPPPTTADLPVVSVLIPGTAAVARSVAVTGTIAARWDIPIGADADTGRIAAVLVEAGDRVQKGQVLARIDTATLAPEVDRLAATVEQARAEAELAAAEYSRAAAVSAAGALSQEEIERRRASAVTATARVRVAEAQLAESRARLARSEVRAPATGIVLERNAEVGQIAGPAANWLFRLAGNGQVELRGQVAEQDLARVSVGQAASVTLTGITTPFVGKVRLVGAVIDPNTRLGEVRIALDADPRLRPGAFAQGEVDVGTEQRPVVPQTAILSDAAGTHVMVIGAGDKAERREVRLGGATRDGVVIAAGLTGQERVVALAGAFLRPGEQVSVALDPATKVATQQPPAKRPAP